MSVGEAGQPRLEIAVAELDHTVALGADQMVMVALAAQPVARLAGTVAELVDNSSLAERSQRPVHGRQAYVLAFLAQRVMDFLRRRVVLLLGQRRKDSDPLARRAQAVTGEQLGGIHGHVIRIPLRCD